MNRLFFPLFIFLFITGSILFHQYTNTILIYVHEVGHLAPFLFVIFYIIATLFFFPTLVLTFAGGAFFGPVLGTVVNLIGACTGATLAFCISRYKLAHRIPIRQDGKFQQLIHGMERYGWYFLALVRALPLIPFNLVNYGMGLTNMPLRTYVLISLVFLTPTEIFYTWCGHAGRQALMMHNVWNTQVVLIAGSGLLITAVVVKWRRSLQRRKQTRQNGVS